MQSTGRRYKHLTNECELCRKLFRPYYGRRDQRFCSNACYLKDKAQQFTDKVCPRCGVVFSVPVSNVDRYVVCSLACRRADTKYVDCDRCGKRFRAERRLNRHYCSEACRRPIHLLTCLTCRNNFRSGPLSTRKFCSFKCYRSYKGETSIETKMRQCLAQLGIVFKQEVPIGRYLADFVLPDHGLIVEVDGEYWHYPSHDAQRDRQMSKYGWKTIRFTEREVRSDALAGLVKDRLKIL